MNRQKGSSLLELIVATALFLILIYSGYESFGRQIRWVSLIVGRTHPETESNYRIILFKQLLENASQRLRLDPLLEPASVFFPGIPDDSVPPESAFSVCYTQSSVPFLQEGNSYRVFSQNWDKAKFCIAAGANSSKKYCWNYARITNAKSSAGSTLLDLEFLLPDPFPERGRITEVQVYTFLYRNKTLYWVLPSGQLQPFFENLDQFHYQWSPPILSIFWQSGEISAEFKTIL